MFALMRVGENFRIDQQQILFEFGDAACFTAMNRVIAPVMAKISMMMALV